MSAPGASFQTADPLAPPSQEARAELRAAEKSATSHRAAMGGLACMTTVETIAGPPPAALSFPLTVAAWNLERGGRDALSQVE